MYLEFGMIYLLRRGNYASMSPFHRRSHLTLLSHPFWDSR